MAIERRLAGDGVAVLHLALIGPCRDDLARKIRFLSLQLCKNLIADIDIGQIHRGCHLNDGRGRNSKNIASCINVTILHFSCRVAKAVALRLDILVWVETGRPKNLLRKIQCSRPGRADRNLKPLQILYAFCSCLRIGYNLINLVIDNAYCRHLCCRGTERADSIIRIGGDIVHRNSKIHLSRVDQVDVIDRCAAGLSCNCNLLLHELIVDCICHSAAQREICTSGGSCSHDEINWRHHFFAVRIRISIFLHLFSTGNQRNNQNCRKR